MFEKEMRNLTYGLFVLSAAADGKSSGCIINTAMQVTDTPLKMAICVNKNSFTGQLIRKSRRFVVSVLDEKADFDIFRHFGFQSGKDVDKFADWKEKAETPDGVPYQTRGANAWIECEVDEEIDLGTHLMYIGFVTNAGILSDVPSASYTYYHEHIKPRQEEKKEGRKAWRCIICGYVYEGADLPADFICAWCKHPARVVERILS